ncbi:hypothetical protein WMY93_019743 [Mugilogobius chulae]|uniref:Pre-B-cell leukemia homeobox interacting protein 1a n=1 Tax=Mugilogobius chulae TaxID=88201 RepID=A0AAW0NF64_9GOBI
MFDKPADVGPISETQEEESLSPPAEEERSKVDVPLETLKAAEGTEPSLPVPHDDSQTEEESKEEPSAVPEVREEPYCPAEVPESPADVEVEDTEGAAPVEETSHSNVEKEETEEVPEALAQDEEEENEPEPSYTLDSGDTDGFDDGLRRRNVPPFEAPRPRTSDEEEDEEEEEVEFKVEEKKDTKPFLSVNKCIVAGLVLLFLGSLFLSGDIDGPEVTEGEQSQDWLSGDPKEMKELLDKLTQENQQIAQLEAQLKAQKEELDAALKAVAVSGDEQKRDDLETENAKLKDELLVLPELRTELETLRARVTELSALSASQAVAPAPSPPPAPEPGVTDSPSNLKPVTPERKSPPNEAHVKEELKRQKKLLEESRKRLETIKNKDSDDRRHVRHNLAEIQKQLSEKVERWGKKKPEWKDNKDKKQWRKEEKKGWKGEKDRKEKYKNDESHKEKEAKLKYNSHKEAWRKNQDEWDRKKGERKMDREERRKEKPWHSKSRPRAETESKYPPQLGCRNVEDCAAKEGLYPVELSEFEELLEGYLSKLDDSSSSSGKDRIRKLTAQFFENGVFIHDRMRFSDFAEEVADILEDAVDILEGHKDNKSLEEEMEEFEREALWKFAAIV